MGSNPTRITLRQAQGFATYLVYALVCVYSSYAVGYKEKYALLYTSRHSQKRAGYFTKEDTTYLFIAPPPSNNPFMKDAWWRVNMLHLTATPSSTIAFSNGYRIEKYLLTKDEEAIPAEATIDPGLSFR